MSCLVLFYFVLVLFSPFSIAMNSLEEERASLGAFRTFALCCFVVYSTRRFVLCLALCHFILFLCFSVLLALQLPRLGKRGLILLLFVRLFDLRLFGFVCFLFLLVSGRGYGL